MSSFAIATVGKTRKHAAVNSVRPHDFNLLIMLTSSAAGSHHGKKAGENLPRRNQFNHTLAQSHSSF
jgi:hypothetical protein